MEWCKLNIGTTLPLPFYPISSRTSKERIHPCKSSSKPDSFTVLYDRGTTDVVM